MKAIHHSSPHNKALTTNPPNMSTTATTGLNKVIASAIAEAVSEAKQQAINEMIEFLSEKIELDDEMLGYFTEFKEKIPEVSIDTKAPKRTRDPSAYNMWIKAKMAEIKQDNPSITGKDLMQAAISEWKKLEVKPTKGQASDTSDVDSKSPTTSTSAQGEAQKGSKKTSKSKMHNKN